MPGRTQAVSITLVIIIILSIPVQVTGEWVTFHRDPARTGYADSPSISGDILWVQNVDNEYIDTSPVLAGNGLVVISAGDLGADAVVHCLDPETGAFRWNTTIPGKTYQLSTPVFAKDRIFFGSSSGIFYCLVADTGSIRWQRPLDVSPYGITSSPAVDESGGNLYVGTGDGVLYNLDQEEGSTIWSFNTGASIYFASPSVHGDTVYIGNDNGILYAVRNGNEVWRYPTGGRIRSSAAVAEDGTIYFTSEDGFLRSLTPHCELNWEYEIGESVSTPAIGNGMVVVGSSSGLHALTQNGSGLFHIPTNGPVDSSPALSRDQVFFTTNSQNGELTAADLNGEILWSIPLEDHVLSSPALGDTTLFAASDVSKVWCFYSTTPESLELTIDPIPELEEGEQSLDITGTLYYDSGRPASGAQIKAGILEKSTVGKVAANGTFALNLTLELRPGNYTLVVSAFDGELESEVKVNLTVSAGKEQNDSEDDDDFLPFPGAIQMVMVFIYFILMQRWKAGKGKRRE